MGQPDVIQFVRDWLRDETAGTSLERVPIEAYDDPGTLHPPFIILDEAGHIHLVGLPAYQPYRIGLTTYGRTNREAGAIYRAATDLLHDATNVLGPDGIGFWSAQDETGPSPGPEGRWPARTGVIAVYMPDRAITTGS